MDLMNFQRDSSREKEKKSEMKENSLSTQQNTKDQKGLLPNMICQHWTTQKKKKKFLEAYSLPKLNQEKI